jgi:tRNA threonylcarbamoyl adenosine modification protein (Sua5/YciO/YrdC/YwlC family)
MKALQLKIHSETPEMRKIAKVVEALREGAVVLYPTDTGFSLGCELSNKEAITRIRRIRQISLNKSLTFLCRSLSNLAEFAKVSNQAYKTIRGLIPGPYTFILPASRQVPKFAQNPKRKTAGIRVPDNTLAQLLLKELDQPMISITAKRGDEPYIDDPDELVEAFLPMVDVAVSSDSYDFAGESTIIDMTDDVFTIRREGAGMDKVYEYVKIEEEV